MKHIMDFEDYKWFQLETREEAEADHEQTGNLGAFPFWGFTDKGGRFYVLRDENERTLQTTLVFHGGVSESKAHLRVEPGFHRKAVEALAESLGNVRVGVVHEYAGIKSVDELDSSGGIPTPGR